MKKVLGILLVCVMVMAVGSAMAVEFPLNQVTDTQNISTKIAVEDKTDITITWGALPTVTYTWVTDKWNVTLENGVSPEITFSAKNNHGITKQLKAEWAPDANLTTNFGLTMTASDPLFTIPLSLDYDTPNSTGKLTLAVNAVGMTGIVPSASVDAQVLGTVTFNVTK